MKKKLPILLLLISCTLGYYLQNSSSLEAQKSYKITSDGVIKPKHKPENARQRYAEEREKYEFDLQKNPITKTIPRAEKKKEFEKSLLLRKAKLSSKSASIFSNTYVSRGPSNLGGRTRAFAIDIADNTSKIMLSGGVSSGLFRSINGGNSWTRVSSLGEIHNVTTLAQDPRVGFQNIWYYGTGEWSGNSASSNGSAYRGKGIWKSINNGQTWSQITVTNSDFTRFDNFFDYVNTIRVHPITGHLFIATTGKIYRYDGTNMIVEIEMPSNGLGWTDVVINNNGRVFAAIEGGSNVAGIWTSPNGTGSWTRIAHKDTPVDWDHQGRIVLANAPSNNSIIYVLYNNGKSNVIENGKSNVIEADLWKYDLTTSTWTNYSAKLPDEPDGDSPGNDPFAIQGGYDLVVSVKPDNENYVVIGGTNVYKIEDITTDETFTRIGGYKNNAGYNFYDEGNVDHHPDIHVLQFDPNNYNTLFTGTDGGVHKTVNITQSPTVWENLNNNYVTYQYYHVDLDPLTGSNIVIGGAQDNGTTIGGTQAGFSDNSQMNLILGGDGVSVGLTRRDNNTTIQYIAGFQNGIVYTNYPDFREITPSGAPTGEDSDIFITYFYLDPDNVENLYYAGNNTLYKTDKTELLTTEDWNNLGELSTGELLRTFATTRGSYNSATSYLLIGGGSGGIFKVNDPKSATDLTGAINITPPGATINEGSLVVGLAIHPTNPDIVLATYSNYGIPSIFITKNATSVTPTWTLVERNLEAHSIRSAAITQVDGETIYFVGTARGLYSSSDPETKNWQLEGANSIGLAVVSSLVYRPSDNKLLIGTHGNGMFETTVQGTLSDDDFRVNNTITSYPNPARNELFITSTIVDLNLELNYSILDINGKTVKRGKFNQGKISVSDINPGVYILNVNSEGKNYSTKFLKQ